MTHRFLLTLLLLSNSCFLFAQYTSDTWRRVDSLINASYPDSLPGISVLIAKDGNILYQKAFGMADMEQQVKLSTDNVFAIGSMTKQFTAVGVLTLVQNGKISLSDDIKKYFPDYNTHDQTITVENLLSHTSGIPSFTEVKGFEEKYQDDETPEEIIQSFKDSTLLFVPGSDWSYTNSGYTLSAYLIEKVSGIKYHDYMKAYVFNPAGLNATYFGDWNQIIPNRARGYDPMDSIRSANTAYFSWSWPYGAGDILSCSGDLLKWDEALYTEKILKQPLLEKAFTSVQLSNGSKANYGYGWAINEINGHKVIVHGGAINGFLSQGIRIPDQHLYIVGLSNFTGKGPAEVIDRIALLLLGSSLNDPAAVKIPAKKLAEYTGVYEMNRQGGRVVSNYGSEKQYRSISIEDDKLFSQTSGGSKGELIAMDADHFYLKSDPGKRFVFLRDNKNKITALKRTDYPLSYGPDDVGMKTNLPLPEPPKEVKVDAEILGKYIGTYELQKGFNLEIMVEGQKLYVLPTGQSRVELHPTSNTHFTMKEVDAQVDFNADADGKINSLSLTQGQKYECKRVK